MNYHKHFIVELNLCCIFKLKGPYFGWQVSLLFTCATTALWHVSLLITCATTAMYDMYCSSLVPQLHCMTHIIAHHLCHNCTMTRIIAHHLCHNCTVWHVSLLITCATTALYDTYHCSSLVPQLHFMTRIIAHHLCHNCTVWHVSLLITCATTALWHVSLLISSATTALHMLVVGWVNCVSSTYMLTGSGNW